MMVKRTKIFLTILILAIITAGFPVLAAKRSKPAVRGFYLNPSKVEMKPDSIIRIKAKGGKGRITRVTNASIVDVAIDQDLEEISLRAVGRGRSRIVFSRGEAKAELLVNIKEPAGVIPDRVHAEVMGDPATDRTIHFALLNALNNSLKLNPGAKFVIGKVDIPSELKSGQKAHLKVPVKVSGSGYIPLTREVPVTIRNLGAEFSDMETLMVSDRPEGIYVDGILFKSEFTHSKPSRLLYYHQNVDKKNRTLWVELKNPTHRTVKVMTSGAFAGPSRWGVTVGHMAAYRFLESCLNRTGSIITLRPGESQTMIQMEIPPWQVLAGYLHMEVAEGDRVEVYVKNARQRDDSVELPIINQPFDPFRIHPKGVFVPADIKQEIQFEAGRDEDAACVIGKAPWLIDPVSGEPNNGNYGVFYRYKIKLKNSKEQVSRIGFYLIPDSRLARGSFILDGELIHTDIVRKPDKRLFAIRELQPGEERLVSLLTTPEGGSYYPVRILIKELKEEEVIKSPDMDKDALEKLEQEEEKLRREEQKEELLDSTGKNRDEKDET